MKDVFNNIVIVKRSGQRVDFNGIKIAIAIKKAFDSVYDDNREKEINKVYEKTLEYIAKNFASRKTITVEQIQDIIESTLEKEKFKEVYTAFSEYRKRRSISRNMFLEKQQHKFVKAIEKIVDSNFDNDNSLKSADTINKFGKIIADEYSKAYILDNKYVRLHDAGSICIHNITDILLGIPEKIYLQIDFDDYINNDSLCEFTTLIAKFQKEVEKEIVVGKLDTILSSWLCKKYYKLLNKNIKNNFKLLGLYDYLDKEKLESIIKNQNDINVDIGIFKELIFNKEVENLFNKTIINTIDDLTEFLKLNITSLLITLNSTNKKDFIYTITVGSNSSYTSNLITNCLIDVLLENKKFEHIIIIYKHHDNDEEIINRLGKLLLENKVVFQNSNNKEYYSDGKLALYNDQDDLGNRMILASTSINMARLGIKYQEKSVNELYKELDDLLEHSKNQLLSVFNFMANKTKENYYILFNNNIDNVRLDEKQRVRKAIKNSYLNIELIGLKECAVAMQKDDSFIIEVLKHINKRVASMIDEHKLNFVVSETTDEKVLKSIIAFDKSIYGIKKGITDKNQYQTINNVLASEKNNDEVINRIKEINKYLSGGFLVKINVGKYVNSSKILDIIEKALNSKAEIFEIASEKGDTT